MKMTVIKKKKEKKHLTAAIPKPANKQSTSWHIADDPILTLFKFFFAIYHPRGRAGGGERERERELGREREKENIPCRLHAQHGAQLGAVPTT